jgi:hypothetical protein
LDPGVLEHLSLSPRAVDPERPQYIMTEIGIGYRLRAPD